MQATGEFDVTLQPLEGYADGTEGNDLGRMSIDKTFVGDLTASSRGEMLMAQTATPGSAGYVAIEQVTGMLHDRHGTFVLQHFGVMHDGDNRLTLEVVPGSGTGELLGLHGSMTIAQRDGQHYYTLDYTLD